MNPVHCVQKVLIGTWMVLLCIFMGSCQAVPSAQIAALTQTQTIETSIAAASDYPYPGPIPQGATANVPLPTITPLPTTEPSGHLFYLWPQTLPEGYSIEPQFDADQYGFSLSIQAPTPAGRVFANEVMIGGGLPADKIYQSLQQDYQLTITIHGEQALVSDSGSDSVWIVWREDEISYYVSGIGVDRNALIQIAENTILLDYDTWLSRMTQ
jgi:hypothetical protein